MEAILFTLDVFFMLILVLGVVRRYRKKGPTPDLGFFAYSVNRTNQDVAERGKARA